MTTAVQIGSAYPATVEELLPKARDLAVELGEVPSRNRLKRELRIGAPKAAALRDALLHEQERHQYRQETHRYHLIRGGLADLPVASEPPTASRSEPVEPGPGDTVDEPSRPDPALPNVGPPSQCASQAAAVADPGTAGATRVVGVRSWPVLLLALPAFVAIWSGWVGLGGLTGFGIVHPLPGIADRFTINSAITLPVGVEAYAAYAIRAWLSPGVPVVARRFARWSAIGSLLLGALGQVAYHLLVAAHVQAAPVWITTMVACLPVAVAGMGAALAHLLHAGGRERR